MKRSSERILTTHVGSLPRPREVIDFIKLKANGQPFDQRAFDETVRAAVRDSVARQVKAGVDVVSDGEQGKSGFQLYVSERLGGFEARPVTDAPALSWIGSKERAAFPEFYQWADKHQSPTIVNQAATSYVCTGPIVYTGQEALQRDIDNLKAALAGQHVEEAFMPALAASMAAIARRNEYYRTEEEYAQAIADAMRVEYRAIVDAGFILQIDDPRLTSHYTLNEGVTIEEWRRWAARQVEVINYSLQGIPEDKVRFHTCYSIDIGPRVYDLEVRDVVDIMLNIKAGAYSFEASNPRHEHEYHIWESVKLPEGKALIPGVISHTTNLVEHPDLVAERIVRFARLVGRENVIAGGDCGFAATAREEPDIHPTVVWAKLEALAEGARRATRQLW